MPAKGDLKSSAARYRTWGGERFECWSTGWNDESVARYRAAGITVRRLEGETFIRRADWALAALTDFLGRVPDVSPELRELTFRKYEGLYLQHWKDE